MAKLHRLMPDTEFAGAFRVERAIGEGAMGTVYRATRLQDGSPCALKVLKPSIAADARSLERFAREANVGAIIGHEHVVDVHGAGFDEDTGLHWISMEYLEGSPLSAYLRSGSASGGDTPHPGPRDERVALLMQLFDAMARAHQAGVLHRDLKPENLFVVGHAADAHLKVLDFGVAKTFAPSLAASATEGGLGTPLWAAPEQGKAGEHIRPSADVWSLGLLSFYLLTGKIFWRHVHKEGSSMLDIAREMLQEPIAAPSVRATELGVALPAGFDAWFLRSVNRNPAERFADAGAARDALVKVLRGGSRVPWCAVAVAIIIAAAVVAYCTLV